MVPAWLATIIIEKFSEAGVSLAQNLRKNLPPSEEQIKSYLHSTAQQLETIPYKIPCAARSAGLAVETFFLWPQLDVARQRKEIEEEPERETLQARILAQDLLFSPPPGKNLFAVEGPAGVGKTTLAQSLVYWAAVETLKFLNKKPEASRLARPLLPLYLDAGDLAKIADGQTQSGVLWEEIPGNWGLLVVVDGLDELGLSVRTRALNRMKGPWLQRTDENLVFLFGRPGSARSLSWESREERILALELRPWALEEVKSYLEKWAREGSLQEAEAERILRHVRENLELPILPLLVYLLVCDFLQTGEVERLPQNRRELYDRYLIQAIFRESEEATQAVPGPPHPLSGDEIFALGCLELAIKEEPQLEAEVHRPRPSCVARQVYGLEQRWKQLCKGNQASWDDLVRLWERRKFCWLGHKSFHDYLAAKALARIYEGRPEDFWREWIHPRVFDPYWTQTLVFAAALLPDADRGRILTGILALAECDPISQATQRHHAIISEILAESESAEEKILNAWLAQKPAPEHVARIHRTAPEWSLVVLEKLAKERDLWVRLKAAEALAQLGHHEKALPALERLAKDRPWVFPQAAQALARLGERALPALERLAKHQDPLVRANIATALAQLGEKALPNLEQLAKDQNPGVRLRTAEALAQLGYHEMALPALKQLAQDYNFLFRLEAARALAQLGRKALPALERLAQDKHTHVRASAAKSIGQLGYREKALLVLEQLAKDQDPWVRLEAARDLAQLGYHEIALHTLEQSANDQDTYIRFETTKALAQLGEIALPALERLINDQDPDVRLQAARGLIQLGLYETALPDLEQLAKDLDLNPDLKDLNPDLHLEAARALAQLGHPPLGCEELPENEPSSEGTGVEA